MLRPILKFAGCAALLSTACGDPAEFRPARGVKDLPSEKTAYRVKDADPSCQTLGFVRDAESIADIAETTANHGGTHFRVLDDNSSETVETDFNASHSKVFGGAVTTGHATSRVEKHHRYVAEAYRCK